MQVLSPVEPAVSVCQMGLSLLSLHEGTIISNKVQLPRPHRIGGLDFRGKESVNILHAEVAVCLHPDPFDIGLLLCRVLPLALAPPVDGDLAIALHLEFDRAVVAPEAVACE